ncbi:hypothetical protein BC940DRAFT_302184 [Gongronella butleri]|nr:hypothetical protein BC940DRAFT_302184 [Gongronella butleri]
MASFSPNTCPCCCTGLHQDTHRAPCLCTLHADSQWPCRQEMSNRLQWQSEF